MTVPLVKKASLFEKQPANILQTTLLLIANPDSLLI